jgi:hypothetical protein
LAELPDSDSAMRTGMIVQCMIAILHNLDDWIILALFTHLGE